ncbi:MAG: hypothetical protein AABY22_32105 [Nanoarchaeota archaeon]
MRSKNFAAACALGIASFFFVSQNKKVSPSIKTTQTITPTAPAKNTSQTPVSKEINVLRAG